MLFRSLIEVHDQVARASRPRYVLEMAVARLVSVRPAQPLGALVDRLVEVERRLRGSGVAPRPSGPRAREAADDPEGERRR